MYWQGHSDGEENIRDGGKTTSSLNICQLACPHSISQLICGFKDDVTVILLLGVSFKVTALLTLQRYKTKKSANFLMNKKIMIALNAHSRIKGKASKK